MEKMLKIRIIPHNWTATKHTEIEISLSNRPKLKYTRKSRHTKFNSRPFVTLKKKFLKINCFVFVTNLVNLSKFNVKT